jgi:hypothetical protein
VAEFSHIVSDAFAGETWFSALNVLDGRAPNTNHHVLARWAREGSLRAIVTTNFDTLIERALVDLAVPFRPYDALVDGAPANDCGLGLTVVKLHGTTSRRASLVDLATQKRRGLQTEWLDWLEVTFGSHRVAVAGFSGADLALGEDYLRLKAAARRTPGVYWLHRPGQPPAQDAREIVALSAPRSLFVEGNLPDDWCLLGAPQDAVRERTTVESGAALLDDAKPDVSAAVAAWLDNPMVDADTCGVALSRLLDEVGSRSAAQSLRTSILARTRRQLQSGVSLTTATRAAHQIGQLAGDEPLERAERAIILPRSFEPGARRRRRPLLRGSP